MMRVQRVGMRTSSLCGLPRRRPPLPSVARVQLAMMGRMLSSNGEPKPLVEDVETRLQPRGQRSSFWRKWEHSSEQEFWQELGLDNDKAYEERTSPARRKGANTNLLEEDEYDDLSLITDLADEEYELLGAEDGNDSGGGRSEALAAGRHANDFFQLRDNLCKDGHIDLQRRGELLGLLEELGNDATKLAEPMPVERKTSGLSPTLMDRESLLNGLLICPTVWDWLEMKEKGTLQPEQYFAHILHTRRVTKVLTQGKRVSTSVLAVVGNGAGTAGFGMGKDAEAPHALNKAIKAAKKNLLYIDRFDNRTVFHDFEGRFAKTKLVLKIRRAGSGRRCNWLMWKIFNAFGISDVNCKVHGSRNNITQTHCIFNALQRMSTPQAVANRRGKRILDFTPRSSAAKHGHRAD